MCQVANLTYKSPDFHLIIRKISVSYLRVLDTDNFCNLDELTNQLHLNHDICFYLKLRIFIFNKNWILKKMLYPILFNAIMKIHCNWYIGYIQSASRCHYIQRPIERCSSIVKLLLPLSCFLRKAVLFLFASSMPRTAPDFLQNLNTYLFWLLNLSTNPTFQG